MNKKLITLMMISACLAMFIGCSKDDNPVAPDDTVIDPTKETVVAPTFSITTGTYNNPQIVSIASTTTGSSIYYTTDGSTPISSSTLFSSGITVDLSKTIKAIGIKTDMNNSSIGSSSYTINKNITFTNLILCDIQLLPGGAYDVFFIAKDPDGNEYKSINQSVNLIFKESLGNGYNWYSNTGSDFTVYIDTLNNHIISNFTFYPVIDINQNNIKDLGELYANSKSLTKALSTGTLDWTNYYVFDDDFHKFGDREVVINITYSQINKFYIGLQNGNGDYILDVLTPTLPAGGSSFTRCFFPRYGSNSFRLLILHDKDSSYTTTSADLIYTYDDGAINYSGIHAGLVVDPITNAGASSFTVNQGLTLTR
jgi:Chitobiase/beta-hexosaminidase C-terminal domain